MSGILRRQALVDFSHGMVEILDFSLVNTSLGTMIEAGPAFQPIMGAGLWPDRLDQFQRVDSLVPFNPDKIKSLFTEV